MAKVTSGMAKATLDVASPKASPKESGECHIHIIEDKEEEYVR